MARFVLTAQVRMAGPSQAEINAVSNQIRAGLNGLNVNVNVKIPQASVTQLAKVQQNLRAVQKAALSASDSLYKFGYSIGQAAKRYGTFTFATSLFLKLGQSINRSLSDAVEFETQMVKISQVTGQSLQSLAPLKKQIDALGSSLGISTIELAHTSRTLSQANLSARETKIALEAIAKTRLAASFGDLNDTTEATVAILNQFQNGTRTSKIGVDNLLESFDAINRVSGVYAVEAEDITAAVRRAGAAFAAASPQVQSAKETFSQFLALFSTVRQTTRGSAESIATGIRTIVTRIQRASSIRLLKGFGIDLQDAQGQFVGAYQAIEKLSKALESIPTTDARFAQIVEVLGGYRQIDKTIPLIRNAALTQEIYNTALTSTGSINEDVAKSQQTLAVQFGQVRANFDSLIRKFSEDDGIRTIISLFIGMANAAIKLADAIRPLATFAATVFAIKGGFGAIPVFGGLKDSLSGRPSKKNKGGYIEPLHFATGGHVPGVGNSDTVAANLTPGEFVIRKNAVNAIGVDKLKAINSGNFTQHFVTGGSVKSLFEILKNTKTPGTINNIIGKSGLSLSTDNINAIQSLDPTNLPAILAEIKATGGLSLGSTILHGVNVRARGKETFQNSGLLSGFLGAEAVAKEKKSEAPRLVKEQVKKVRQANYTSSGLTGDYAVLNGSVGAIYPKIERADDPINFSPEQIKRFAGKFGRRVDYIKARNFSKLEPNESSFQESMNAYTDNMLNAGVKAIANFLSANGDSSQSPVDNDKITAALKSIGTQDIKGKIFEASISTFQDALRAKESKDRFDFVGIQSNSPIYKLFRSNNGLIPKYLDAKVSDNTASNASMIKKYLSLDNSEINPSFYSYKNEEETKGKDAISYNSFRKQYEIKNKKQLPKLGYFAFGGPAKGTDTVPAMLTPGEFVINKDAAKAIGTSKLNKLNNADKVSYFNKGGSVNFLAQGGSPKDDYFSREKIEARRKAANSDDFFEWTKEQQKIIENTKQEPVMRESSIKASNNRNRNIKNEKEFAAGRIARDIRSESFTKNKKDRDLIDKNIMKESLDFLVELEKSTKNTKEFQIAVIAMARGIKSEDIGRGKFEASRAVLQSRRKSGITGDNSFFKKSIAEYVESPDKEASFPKKPKAKSKFVRNPALEAASPYSRQDMSEFYFDMQNQNPISSKSNYQTQAKQPKQSLYNKITNSSLANVVNYDVGAKSKELYQKTQNRFFPKSQEDGYGPNLPGTKEDIAQQKSFAKYQNINKFQKFAEGDSENLQKTFIKLAALQGIAGTISEFAGAESTFGKVTQEVANLGAQATVVAALFNQMLPLAAKSTLLANAGGKLLTVFSAIPKAVLGFTAAIAVAGVVAGRIFSSYKEKVAERIIDKGAEGGSNQADFNEYRKASKASYGLAGGALVGAGIGAGIGAFGGPVGIGAGALIGAGIGGIVGGVSGAIYGDKTNDREYNDVLGQYKIGQANKNISEGKATSKDIVTLFDENKRLVDNSKKGYIFNDNPEYTKNDREKFKDGGFSLEVLKKTLASQSFGSDKVKELRAKVLDPSKVDEFAAALGISVDGLKKLFEASEKTKGISEELNRLKKSVLDTSLTMEKLNASIGIIQQSQQNNSVYSEAALNGKFGAYKFDKSLENTDKGFIDSNIQTIFKEVGNIGGLGRVSERAQAESVSIQAIRQAMLEQIGAEKPTDINATNISARFQELFKNGLSGVSQDIASQQGTIIQQQLDNLFAGDEGDTTRTAEMFANPDAVLKELDKMSDALGKTREQVVKFAETMSGLQAELLNKSSKITELNLQEMYGKASVASEYNETQAKISGYQGNYNTSNTLLQSSIGSRAQLLGNDTPQSIIARRKIAQAGVDRLESERQARGGSFLANGGFDINKQKELERFASEVQKSNKALEYFSTNTTIAAQAESRLNELRAEREGKRSFLLGQVGGNPLENAKRNRSLSQANQVLSGQLPIKALTEEMKSIISQIYGKKGEDKLLQLAGYGNIEGVTASSKEENALIAVMQNEALMRKDAGMALAEQSRQINLVNSDYAQLSLQIKATIKDIAAMQNPVKPMQGQNQIPEQKLSVDMKIQDINLNIHGAEVFNGFDANFRKTFGDILVNSINNWWTQQQASPNKVAFGQQHLAGK